MKNDVAGTAITMAQGVHRSAHLLDRQLAIPGIEREEVTALGYTVTSTVLRAFAVELAFKALYMQETGAEEKYGHDLRCLFDDLKRYTQDSVERRFEDIRRGKINKGIYSGETGSLRDVLDSHRNDFEEWRYAYEKVGSGGLSTRQLVLNSVMEASVQEYESRILDNQPDQGLKLRVEFNDQANRSGHD